MKSAHLSKEPYKGCRDLFPAEKAKQDYIFEKMHATAEAFGYQHFDGPMLEPVDLYLAKSGEELINDQIYDFTDRGERHVAIRPEMTPTLARMIAQVHREVMKPIRWYSIPNLLRYEKPQRGRLREHWQLNVDIFGAGDQSGELEILQFIILLFENLGATEQHIEILFNDRNIVDTIFTKVMQLSAEQSYKLYKIIDRAKKCKPEEIAHDLKVLLNTDEKVSLINKYLQVRNLDDLKVLCETIGESAVVENLDKLLKTATSLGFSAYLQYDPTIVRGLDYYTGLVFEVFDKNPANRRALCGGGAYANLLELFKEPALPAVGFGLGDVTLSDFLTTHQLFPEKILSKTPFLISYQQESASLIALKLAQTMRRNNLNIELLPGEQKIKKSFQFAETKKHQFLLYLGELELAKNCIFVKDLSTHQSLQLPMDDQLITHLKNLIKER